MIMSKKNPKIFSFDYIFIKSKMKHFKYFLIVFKNVFFQTFNFKSFLKLLVNILHFSKSFSKPFQNISTNLHTFLHDRLDLKIKLNQFFFSNFLIDHGPSSWCNPK